ncbi:MAG: hypothetical protein FJ241_04835 [Nitrospira sp.]|nr:hypothetical protein [Nitrospira sp.]
MTMILDQSTLISYEIRCPYDGLTVCLASFSSMALDSLKRIHCCSTENYDNCPIFLSKVLRRS